MAWSPNPTFLVHAIVALVFGAALWLVPGRFLTLVGWVQEWVKVALVVQLEAVYCLLSVFAGLVVLLFLREEPLPLFGWVTLVFLAAFGAAWVLALRRHG